MSCHQQHGTRAYVALIEAAIGEQITQSDWHQLRVAAAESGRTLKRSRAEQDAKVEAMKMLDEALLIEPDIDLDKYVSLKSSQVTAEELLDGITVTTGTVDVIQYMARHGVRESLKKARLVPNPDDKSPIDLSGFTINDQITFPQANSIPKIASSVDAIDAGADTDEAIAMSLGVVDRQGSYYGLALAYLGLAQETGETPRAWQLTPSGADFLNADPEDRVAILTHLFEQVGEKEIRTGEGADMANSTEERRDAALQSCQKYLDGAKAVEGVSLERDTTRGRVEGAAEHAREQRKTAREAVRPVRRGQLCPVHFTTMSLSGVCDDCS